MDTASEYRGWLQSLRRDLHRRPEPAWLEFYTTARIVEEIREIGVDELHVGRDALATDERMAVPEKAALAEWQDRAREAGAPEDVLDELTGGYTRGGRDPRPRRGADSRAPGRHRRPPARGERRSGHAPVRDGFRSVNDGAMHACGHDAHATIGLGVLRAVSESDFRGMFKLLFQPAEEQIAGGKAVAESGHLDDVDSLLAVHVGLDHPTGEVVAGVDDFLAVSHFEARFAGDSAHAGGQPNRGDNAVQAMAAAVQNLYSIPRHEEGATRINAGRVGGGTATNIIPENAFVQGEVRGETTELMEYTRKRARRTVEAAAEMHGCTVDIETGGEAPSARSDDEVVGVVADVAGDVAGVERVVRRDTLGGSEDASYLMRHVQEHGGVAGYVCVGTDHPGGHHTATFDVDEASLPIGVDVLAGAVLSLAGE
jgi:amidohydrolase